MDRLRWDNIARAAALLGVIALVVAWPHLRRHGPTLPSAAATPVSVEEPAPVVRKPPRPRPRVVRRRPEPKRARPVRRLTHRRESQPVRRRETPPPPPPPPRLAPRPLPSADDPAAREFALP